MIPVNQPLLDGNEKKYLAECIDSGWISSEGPFVSLFEERFAQRVGRKYGVAVCNGTAAIDLAIEALGISAGDEVILPSFTIISCVNQIIRVGAKPVLIDSDPITWNMDAAQIRGKITDKTKAIMMVHIYGLPVDVDAILSIAKEFDLKVIEDAAEMHGQFYKGRPCGSFGDISTFSFYSNKHITTGEGGMVVINEPDLYETCKELRNLCFQSNKRFVHERLGWNLRMTNMQAALGVAQLERLDEFIEIKRNMGALYSKLLEGLPSVQLPQRYSHGSENIYWVYGLVLGGERGQDAESVMKLLAGRGVGCRPFFCPMSQQPVLLGKGLFKDEYYPVADALYRYGFYVPSGMALTKNQVEQVAEVLWKVLI